MLFSKLKNWIHLLRLLLFDLWHSVYFSHSTTKHSFTVFFFLEQLLPNSISTVIFHPKKMINKKSIKHPRIHWKFSYINLSIVEWMFAVFNLVLKLKFAYCCCYEIDVSACAHMHDKLQMSYRISQVIWSAASTHRILYLALNTKTHAYTWTAYSASIKMKKEKNANFLDFFFFFLNWGIFILNS